VTRILIVRHGETEWNAAGRVQGWTDSCLSDRGRAQAARLAARLAATSLAAVYASDLSRARDTALALAGEWNLPVITQPGLRERCYGDWEGLTPRELETRYPDGWHRYHVQRDLNARVPGGENWEEVFARFLPVLHQIIADHPGPEETVALVGHGGSLRAGILDALNAPLATLLRLRLDNASLSRLDYRGADQGCVVFLNDTSHLEGVPA